MSTITIQNLTPIQQPLRAYDGTVTLVPGFTVAVVDEKFGWAIDLAIFKVIVPPVLPNLPFTNMLSFEMHGTNNSTIPTGPLMAFEVPYNAVILRVAGFFDQVGSMVFDLYNGSYSQYPTSSAQSMSGGAGFTITGAQKYLDTELLNFTSTAIDQYSNITLVISSVTSFTWGSLNFGLYRVGS